MEVEPFENPWIKKIRMLTHLLIVSMGINLALTIVIINFAKNKSEREPKKTIIHLQQSNAEVVDAYFHKPFEQLVLELRDKTLVENGYRKRDMALAVLVGYHYFNIEKAIAGKILPKRKLSFLHPEGGESFLLDVFPGLDDLHFTMIEAYLQNEKWPLTTEGLLIELKKNPEGSLESLREALFASNEFYALWTLFKRFDEGFSRKQTLELLLENNWVVFEPYVKWNRENTTPPIDTMRALLRELVTGKSKIASSFWIGFDTEYVEKNLTDEELALVITNVSTPDSKVNIFLKRLLCSIRSDGVRKASALKLYQLEGKTPPDPYSHEIALQEFLPAFFQKNELLLDKGPRLKKHIVEGGESLWKIAKKYNVKIEDLRKINHLLRDKLAPGQELIIP